MVFNLHERLIPAPVQEVGSLIDSLASQKDRLWPRKEWPPMRLDAPLGVGASGGHGPVRYVVSGYEPGRKVEFEFTSPAGFHGNHSFTAVQEAADRTVLRHELTMTVTGFALLSWPVFFRPMHDSLVEESLDRAERECGVAPVHAYRRSLWVSLLRAPFSRRMNR